MSLYKQYRGAVHSIYNLKYSVPKKSPIAFHNGSNYDYHSIKFKKKFTFQEKTLTNTELIEKEVTRIHKNGEKITNNISYILQFIDSARFMLRLLSNLDNNLSEGIYKFKTKYGHSMRLSL